MTGPLVLAIAFVNPLLLAGLGLAAAPIIIHLLARRQFRTVSWGAMHFLKQAEQENRRRVRFEQWLLLALRCLAMGLLGLLFARPFVEPGLVGRLLGNNARTQRIVVLDDSASLSHRDGAVSDFDELRNTFERLLEWLQQTAPDDPLTVFATSRPQEPIADLNDLRHASVADLRARVRRLTPAATRAQPARVMNSVAERLKGDEPGAADVYTLSDFQRSDWIHSEGGAGSPLAALRSPDDATASAARSRTRVVLVQTRERQRPNVAVRSIQLERPQTIAGQPALARVEVANFGARLERDLTIELALDGQPLPALSVRAPEPGATASAVAEITFPEPGFRVLSATCAGHDGFVADDAWRAAVEVKPRLSVLLVNGAPSQDALEDEAHLLRAAIAPPGPLSSGVQVDMVDAAELGATALDEYDVVALCNVSVPAAPVVQAVERYVAHGGGLLITLGDSLLEADAFNLAWVRDGRGLAPLALQGIERAVEENIGWQIIRTGDDPLTTLFPSAAEPVSEYVRFRAFVRGRDLTQPTSAPAADQTVPRQPPRVLAHFNDAGASPALIAGDFGRGRVLMFTSTVDLDWNDWARSVDGSFVVTMLEAVQYLAARSADPPALHPEDRLRVAVSPEAYEPTVVFAPPGPGAAAPLAGQPAGRELLPHELLVLLGPPAMQLGVFQALLTLRSGTQVTRPICVNLAPPESDLAAASRAELAVALGDLPHEFVLASASFLSRAEPPRRELWRYLLMAAVVALILEHTLAWWFGGGHLSVRRPNRAFAATGVRAT